MPDLYLVLDLDAKTDEALEKMPDALPFQGARAIMVDAAINGEGWHREWRAFTDRDKAIAYAEQPGNPTLIVIPLDAETVPLEQTP
jgi:hypothetical protein